MHKRLNRISLLKGEKSSGWGEWNDSLRFAAIVAETALLALAFWTWKLETQAFREVLVLTSFGFVVHHLLPSRKRLSFFAAISVGSLVLVLGWQLGAMVLGIGLCLIGICHLPASILLRVALLGIAAVWLAAVQVGRISVPDLRIIMPILASMFMFRVTVYLYDLKHGNVPVSFAQSVAYFFMVPNVCFPLFPVVDYKLFCKSHYDSDPFEIYQVGVRWIFRGMIHLLLYRACNVYFKISPMEVHNGLELFRYMVTTYLLYLQVSGTFHVIVGILHLFGFNLPETHHLYLLSTSFTDFWRRINIYWKDYIMKLVFYPTFFAIRRIGQTRATIVATLIAFFATWLLHAYQWFWIRGMFLITPQDAMFWAILALLVIMNMRQESKPRRANGQTRPGGAIQRLLRRGAKTIGTFLVICLLWSMWHESSFETWFALLANARNVSAGQAAVICTFLLGVGVAGALFDGSTKSDSKLTERFGGVDTHLFWRSVAFNSSGTLLMAVLPLSAFNAHLPQDWRSVLAGIENPHLNRQEEAEQFRGYYEDLFTVKTFNPALDRIYNRHPTNWFKPVSKQLVRNPPGIGNRELIPNAKAVYRGKNYTINRWGMRDRDYPKEKPKSVYRVALFGQSTEFGWGVSDNETMDHLAESQFHDDASRGFGAPIEILNFSVPGMGPIEKVERIAAVLQEFRPDAVFYSASYLEYDFILPVIARAVNEQYNFPYEFITDVLNKIGVDESTPNAIVRGRIEPYLPNVLGSLYARIVRITKEKDADPYWVFIPHLRQSDQDKATYLQLRKLAQKAGFEILDLSDAYDGTSPEELKLAAWDAHPNATAHRMLAARLYQLMKERGIGLAR